MLQKQGHQILKQKTNSIKKVSRQKQLDSRFNSIRKHMLKLKTQEQIQARRQEQTYLINQLIQKLKENHPNAIFKLWEHCFPFSFRFLAEEHILLLVSKLKKLTNQNLSREEEITMGVWLISNWASYVQHLKEDYQDLIQFFGKLLDENLSAKLNQYILYSFANLCTHAAFASKVIKGSVVDKLLKCPTLIEKEADLLLFINNCLQGLKANNNIQENLLSTILNFLKRSLKKGSTDYFLRKDSFSIIYKLINKTKKTQIITQLSPQLKKLMMAIQSITQLESCRELFAMLTIIAEIDSFQIDFFDQKLQTTLWNCTKSLLCLQNAVHHGQEQNNYWLIKQVWRFMPHFLNKVSNELREQILDWLFQQLLFGDELQSQQQALVILIQNLKDEDSIIQLCDIKLKHFKINQEYTELMLKSLKKVVQKQGGVLKMRTREQLCLYLKSLNFDQNQTISLLAREIQEKLEQNEMDEQVHPKNHILQRS